MRQDEDIRVLLADRADIVHGILFVDFASSVPADHLVVEAASARRGKDGWEDDVFARLPRHVSRQIFVRQEDDGVAIQRFDHGDGIARRAADIGFRLDIRVGVDISHHRDAGEALL